jgi:hypothetical protein
MPELRQPVYRAAADYHAAVARYARALRSGRGLEAAAQAIVGTSLRYHVALESCLRHVERDHAVAAQKRLLHLRRLLEAASRQYDALRRMRRRAAGGFGADW